ncbi:MAG: QueT transporter family protein [archaeon]|nr:QueT transporter family protein [Candidatus Bathyarchaeum sp.]
MNAKDLALTIIFAALYAALVVAFTPIAFGVAQFRIAGALRPAIAKKWILSLGYGLGVLVGNFFSPFAGPWDLLFMPLMSVIAGLAGFLVAKRFKQNYFVSGTVTAVIIAFSLSFMFEQLAISPFLVALPMLLVTDLAACIIGAVVFMLIDKRFKWWNS